MASDSSLAAAPAAGPLPATMPVGRRSPRGRVRWYPVWAPGREQATCQKLKSILPEDILADAFVLRREQWHKRRGAWELRTVPVWEGYLFVSTADAAALDRAMSRLSFPARIAGGADGRFAPLDPSAQAWYEAACDSSRVIRTSTAAIVGGELRVQDGPLVGQEPRVERIDRHKSVCWVRVGEGQRSFRERAPLVVPTKS